ncbi:TPA: hypothetical protein DCE37_25735 [Candidatus Latescibacteria bacterium]|nr:hypothetical protein [Candidatus Latescibacterota bacterium]
MNGRRLILILAISVACGGKASVSVDVLFGDPSTPTPTDPPYGNEVVYPSGLRLGLIPDAVLTSTYPNPDQNPFGSARSQHYQRVGMFLPLEIAPTAERVSENFRLSEYVNATVQRGGTRAYVDPEVVWHVQLVRSGLGRPLNVSSSFRAPGHNRDVGGASFSRHLYGDAADIDVDQNRSDANTRGQEIFNEASDVGVDFVLPLEDTSVDVSGLRRVSWVHLDDRGF